MSPLWVLCASVFPLVLESRKTARNRTSTFRRDIFDLTEYLAWRL
jgi:hypothetical protein